MNNLSIITGTFTKERLLLVFASLFMIFGFIGFSFSQTAYANDLKNGACGGAELSLSSKDCSKIDCSKRNAAGECIKTAEGGLNDLVATIVNLLTVIVGIIAVIMIIIGGFKYITSSGDSNKISSAKNTIIFAIVGLIIVALAQVIVRFVLSKV